MLTDNISKPFEFFQEQREAKERAHSSVHLVLVPLFGYLLLDRILQQGDTHNAFAGSNELCSTAYKNIVSDLFYVCLVLSCLVSLSTFPWHESRSQNRSANRVPHRESKSRITLNIYHTHTCQVPRDFV